MSELPIGWIETTLGETANFVSKKVPISDIAIDNYISTENMLTEKNGVVQSNSLPKSGNVSAYTVGDTLFSNIRTYFKKVWFSNKDGGASNDVIVFRPKDDNTIDNAFLYYLISSDDFIDYTVLTAKGTKMPRGDKDAIRLFPINLPPLPEQKAIADILSSLDNKIELLREKNETLEKLAQVLFKSWFVDFDPVIDNALDAGNPIPEKLHAKAEARKEMRARQDFTPLPNDIRLQFPSEFVESELGWIPKGWGVGKLGDLATLRSGFAFKGNDFIDESNYKALKIKDLKGFGRVEITDVSSISKDSKNSDRVQMFKLNVGDIVLAMSGNTTGKIGIVPEHKHLFELYLNQRVGKFFFNDEAYRNFVYAFLMSNNYEDKILNMGYGSAQPNINPAQIAYIDLLIPNNATLSLFMDIINPMFDKIITSNGKIETLTKTRDTLLPKLLNGSVRVEGFGE